MSEALADFILSGKPIGVLLLIVTLVSIYAVLTYQPKNENKTFVSPEYPNHIPAGYALPIHDFILVSCDEIGLGYNDSNYMCFKKKGDGNT